MIQARRPSFPFVNTLAAVIATAMLLAPVAAAQDGAKAQPDETTAKPDLGHKEVPVPPPEMLPSREDQPTEAVESVMRGLMESIQVNVDALGNNIVGDAANEPSIAIDPTNPDRIVIGWRQFDTITSDFRQAGYAYSDDGGLTWTFPGSLDAGQFRSDPVLASDSDGTIFYYSLSTVTTAEMFISEDAGITWTAPIDALGGDKTWMAVDATGGIGDGHVYPIWNSQFTCCGPGTDFTRSVDGGFTYEGPYSIPNNPKWGTVAVDAEGRVFVVGSNLSQTGHVIARSTNARDAAQTPTFELTETIDLGGTSDTNGAPNPGGLLGQVWVDVDRSSGPTRGNVYVLASVDPPGGDPLDVHFIRSTDGGQTWTAPIRVVDDPTGSAYQWFSTMSVAPNGRIDVVWNDTRNDPTGLNSELYYAYSTDAGDTWSGALAVSPSFNSNVGFPQQNKLGDYYHMISDELGGALAYAATFNGEQDVYFLRVGDCNGNDRHDSLDVDDGTSEDCNANGVPDECEPDCNDNGIADGCDLDAGTSADCNANRIPDECDISEGRSEDCNSDGLPDECDVEDDLETDLGWTAGVAGDTATTGVWERVDPVGTSAQPENDHTDGAGVFAYVTGQGNVGGGLGDNDVDGGFTTLVSRTFDLSGLGDPTIGYWRWYSNDQGSSPNDDVFTVDISDDGGANWTNLEVVGPSGPGTAGGWIYASFRVSEFVTPTDDVVLRFIAEDADPGSIVEAAVDDVVVVDCAACNADVPGETQDLRLQLVDEQVAELSWALDPDAEVYDVYRGSNPDASDLACLADGIVGTRWEDDGAVPAPGGAFFHVVTSKNCAGVGPLGKERTASEPCP